MLRRVCASLIAGAAVLSPFAAHATPILVIDTADQNVLYAEEPGRPWYPASTTKLMTALVTFEAIRAGRVSLDTPVVMSANAMSQGFLEAGLHVGSTMKLEDALYSMISGSTNDVAVAIAETVAGSEPAFVGEMNATAKRLGMTGSRFANPNGLFDRSQQVTARDMALLGIEISRKFPEYKPYFLTTAVVIDGKTVESHNELLTRYPGSQGLKTGFLCASGNNVVALAEQNGKEVMVVVMGATTPRERSERAAMYFTQAFDGKLQPAGKTLTGLPNDAKGKPEDMRMNLCSKQSAKYEKKREALYPMGLPGQPSYLAATATAGNVHQIKTWETAVPAAKAEKPAAKKPAAKAQGTKEPGAKTAKPKQAAPKPKQPQAAN